MFQIDATFLGLKLLYINKRDFKQIKLNTFKFKIKLNKWMYNSVGQIKTKMNQNTLKQITGYWVK